MVTKKKAPALFVAEAIQNGAETKYSGAQKRIDQVESDNHKNYHQPVSNGLKIKLDHLKTFDALTPNQQIFYDMYNRGDYCMGVLGSAGTGKTFISLYKALEEVLDKSNPFRQMVVVRSCVPTRNVGFLPGSLEEKQEIYELPYKEIAATLFDRSDAWDRLKEQNYARFISTTAIRGISIDDSIVVVDELQNMTMQELDTIITRVGYRSKIIFVGDIKQTDLVTSKYDVSGLPQFIKILNNMNDYSEIEFTSDDIVRSSLVRNYIIAKECMGY
jgi:phosphate starvation-inducible PhoH-like protein/PhoH-like ATPase